jgi:hypothetical protein
VYKRSASGKERQKKVQNFLKRGTCSFFFCGFLAEGQVSDLQRLHLVSLQTWQKVQSAHGFFLGKGFFPILLL